MNRKLGIGLLLGGGGLTLAGVLYGVKKSSDTTKVIADAIDAPPVSLPLSPMQQMSLPTFAVHATGYWPYVEGLSAEARKMEGGKKDRKGRPIHTLEQHMRDPIAHPYVSVAGDFTVFPDGQRVILSPWPNVIARIVDTGGHFFGSKKVFRVWGEEPLDIAVDSSKTVVPKKGVTAQIVPGDTFGSRKGPQAVASAGFKGQNVVLGYAPADSVLGYVPTESVIDAFTTDDHEALARALESELGGRSQNEQIAAGWAMRNHADLVSRSVHQLLAPRGEYGSPELSGGHASTRRAPTAQARAIASTVLGASTDPTDGATDFWMPEQQAKMRQLGDVYRAARSIGDSAKAEKYSRYANFGTEDEARAHFERKGFRPVRIVGAVELLKRGG